MMRRATHFIFDNGASRSFRKGLFQGLSWRSDIQEKQAEVNQDEYTIKKPTVTHRALYDSMRIGDNLAFL
jgi:hypothetical protein